MTATGYVDEEDPPPGPGGDEESRDDRAEGPAQAGHATEDADGLGPLLGFGKEQGDETEGRRSGDGLTRALGEPAGHEHGRVDGRAAQGRRDGEYGHANQEHPTPSEQIGQSTAEQDQPASREHVAVDHPGQAGPTESEVVLDVREGDIHHGDVEHQHELDQSDDAERLPTMPIRGRVDTRRVARAGGVPTGVCGHGRNAICLCGQKMS